MYRKSQEYVYRKWQHKVHVLNIEKAILGEELFERIWLIVHLNIYK